MPVKGSGKGFVKMLLSCYLQGLVILSPFHTALPPASYPCSFSPQSFSVSYPSPFHPLCVTRHENLDQFLHLSSSHPSGCWQLSEGGMWEPTWARTHHCYYPYLVSLCWSRTPLCYPNTAQEGPKCMSPEDET